MTAWQGSKARDHSHTDIGQTIDKFDRFARRHSTAGMPSALPALSNAERGLLAEWLGDGAPYDSSASPTPLFQAPVERWESFFNRTSNNGCLISRILYEHLFQAHSYFPELSSVTLFRLAHSATPAIAALAAVREA